MPSSVLLIDSDAFLGGMYANALRSAGFEVRHETTGHEGLQAVLDRPDVVVLDVLMPRMAAFEILERVQANASAYPPIIVMTSLAHRRDIDRCLRLGVSRYLVKTHHTPEDLTQQVCDVLPH